MIAGPSAQGGFELGNIGYSSRPVISEPPATAIVCAQCGTTVWLSARRGRVWRDRDYTCGDCRQLNAPLTEEERERWLAWWRETYSPTELERLEQALASLKN